MSKRDGWPLIPGAALLVCLAACAHADGLARLVEYRSPIDDSTQAYGVYVPAGSPPSSDGYPAVLHGHGYGWSVSANFSAFQRAWADEHRWVLINLNARGPNFYEGVGDIETLNVVEDAAARFGLDRDRVYMTGGSMGGTGALRQGVRHPDVFAAVMGVDGWTDFREWHWHWYARTDLRDDIEEFRRPLLEAASPLYWAERGRWGAIGHIVDGSDTTVLPENGLRLRNRLVELGTREPVAYDYRLIFNPLLGHGGGTDYRAIYGFFEGRRRIVDPSAFTIETTILPHGQLYWGRIDGFVIDGISGGLEVHADADAVAATTSNVSDLTLFLGASPLADEATVRVFVDGFAAYEGPPETLALEAELDAGHAVVGWRPRVEPASLRKRPGMSGPIGDGFLRPFLVAWASAGDPVECARHRLEAEQFAREWNAFMVHGQAVEAVPEERIDPADLASHTVVLFGALDTSELLRRADAVYELPVRIRNDGVTVRDPLGGREQPYGERRYAGAQFGAMLGYPNPLTDFATYLVVVNRRVFTQPDGTVPQLLSYDLEKLPWAYPDYVVFNADQAELPHVINVNNKPPVTCYEAGYYVEAGYFDDDWRMDRGLQLRRVRRQKPTPHRPVHVAELTIDRGASPPAARVRITDSAGKPVATARVTGRWWGEVERATSASADEDGRAVFPAPAGIDLDRAGFEIVNVMATGATYDWTADVARTLAPGEHSPRQLELTLLTEAPTVAPGDALELSLAVNNNAPVAREVRVGLAAPSGRVIPESRGLRLGANARATVSFTWRPEVREPGPAALRAEVVAPDAGVSAALPLRVQVLPSRGVPLVITNVKSADIEWGQPWKVTAIVRSFGCEPIGVDVRCALLEARRFPAAKRALVPPGGAVTLEWTGDDYLEKGEYTVRVSAQQGRGLTATGSFAVR